MRPRTIVLASFATFSLIAGGLVNLPIGHPAFWLGPLLATVLFMSDDYRYWLLLSPVLLIAHAVVGYNIGISVIGVTAMAIYAYITTDLLQASHVGNGVLAGFTWAAITYSVIFFAEQGFGLATQWSNISIIATAGSIILSHAFMRSGANDGMAA